MSPSRLPPGSILRGHRGRYGVGLCRARRGRPPAGVPLATDAYLYGGRRLGATWLSNCDGYHQADDSWSNKTGMPAPARGYLSGATVGDAAYAVAGRDAGSYYQDCDEYDPDVWTGKAALPAPARCYHAASAIGSASYCYGGQDSVLAAVADCDEHTPAGDAWANKTDLPVARFQLAATTIGSAAYTFGGWITQECNQYIPDTWTSKADLISSRALHAAATVGGRGYIFGGGPGARKRDCDEYVPDTWTNKSDLPLPARSELAAASVAAKAYVCGGEDGVPQDLRDCDEYTPGTNSWTSKTDMPVPTRRGLAASGLVA